MPGGEVRGQTVSFRDTVTGQMMFENKLEHRMRQEAEMRAKEAEKRAEEERLAREEAEKRAEEERLVRENLEAQLAELQALLQQQSKK